MYNKFKDGEKVFVFGPGENCGKFYNNVPATIIERDPYYKDYHVEFKDGSDDWFLSIYILKRHHKKKRRRRKKKNES